MSARGLFQIACLPYYLQGAGTVHRLSCKNPIFTFTLELTLSNQLVVPPRPSTALGKPTWWATLRLALAPILLFP